MTERRAPEVGRRFKPYPAHKDSGVEWLGEIPAHWEVRRLKFVAPARINKLNVKPDDAAYVGLEHVESWTGRLLLDNQPESVDSVVASFRAGDVLFGKLRPYLAKAARPHFDGVCTSEILPLRPTASCSQSYVMYCLLNAPHIRWLDSLTYGTKMPRVSPEQVGSSFVPIPTEPEQRAIAAFLDRETATIDALVAKKERLIELLQEKRTALIARAVTKGLDLKVPMKDSGVEWLGEIPAHWEVVPLKRALLHQVTNGLFKKREAWGAGSLIINVVDLYRADFRIDAASLERVEAQPHEITAFAAHVGDIFFVRSSLKREGVGSSACLTEAPEPIVFECHLVRARPSPRRVVSRYLAAYLNASIVRQRLVAISETTTMTTIAQSSLETLEVVLPPKSEQEAALAWLELQTAKIDALVAKVRDAIDRLKELRTALISAAVTGKIDVREEASA